MLKYLACPLVLLMAMAMSGCGGIQVANQVANNLRSGNYAEGLALLEKEKNQYSGPNNLLYYFERGTLLQRVEDYPASIKDLGTAEDLIQQFAATSVSQAALSFLVNDMTMDYSGEDFEQVMVNVIKGLDYSFENDLEGALVEARKVNTRLVQLSGKYGQDAVYKEDAFARYLSAFIQEADGEYNDAYIDYKLAFKDFQWYQRHYGMPIPTMIQADLLRLSRWLGFDEDYQSWRQSFGDSIPDAGPRPKKQCELLLVVFDGVIPEKTTRYVAVPIEDPDHHPYVLKVAFPVFRPRPNVVARVRVGLPDGTVAESQMLEPLDAIAIQNLDQRIGLISAKAIARATAKYIAAYQTRRLTGDNPLIDIATNIFTFVTEQADTRSWRTLPNKFHVVRMQLPAGKQNLEVRIETMHGGIRSAPPLTVDLKAGQKKILPLYVTE